MARRPLPILEIILVVLCAAAFALVVGVKYERDQAAQPRYNTFSSLDKSGGGYAAWYTLLQREGVRVGRFERRPAYLSDDIDVLVISPNVIELEFRARLKGNLIGQFADVDFSALRDWVRRGGRLIWLTDGSESSDALAMPILTERGPTRDTAVPIVSSPATAGVDHVDGTSRLRAPFGQSAISSPLIADDTGAVVMRYPLGKGSVTIVTDQTLFSNARLARADNARLAYDIVAAGLPRSGAVAFDEWVHGFAGGDTWWAILPQPMRAALILAAAALLLVVVGSALRFGPTALPPQDVERTSAEYLASMATLMARGRAASKAVRDLADASRHDVARALGVPDSTPIRELCRRMTRASDGGASADALLELDRLRSYESPTAGELVRAAQLSATLRKEYVRDGRIGILSRRALDRRSA